MGPKPIFAHLEGIREPAAHPFLCETWRPGQAQALDAARNRDVIDLFLICALCLPSPLFSRPAIVGYQAMGNEEDEIRKFLQKNNPGAEVYFTPKGQEDKLKEHGWERVPFTWKGNEVWIQRKPKSDKKPLKYSA